MKINIFSKNLNIYILNNNVYEWEQSEPLLQLVL